MGVGYGCGWEGSENADFTENKTLHNTSFSSKNEEERFVIRNHTL